MLIVDTFFTDPTEYKLDESQGDGGPLVLQDVVLGRVDEVNGNRRLYPRAIIEKNLQSLAETISKRGLYGETDHPRGDESSEVRLSRASHLITDARLDQDGTLRGTVEILEGPFGRQLEACARARGRIGFSTRGLGSTSRRKDGVSVVGEDFQLVTIDAVGTPSARGAYAALAESIDEQETESMKPSLNELQQRVSSLTGAVIGEMSESERRLAVQEARSILSDLDEVEGKAASVRALADSVGRRIHEIESTDKPTPARVLEAAESIIGGLKTRLQEANKAARGARTQQERLRRRLARTERVGQRVLDQLHDSRRRYQAACVVGDRLLERVKGSKKVTTKNESKSPVAKRVDRVLREYRCLRPMRSRLLRLESVDEVNREARDLLRFYRQGRRASAGLTEAVQPRRSGKATRRASSNLTPVQQEQAAILESIDSSLSVH